jgi:YD repeat-containing protein
LTGIAHSHATTGPISSFGYGHSPEGRITEWTRTTRPGVTTDRYDFTYDGAGRLTEALLKNDSTGAILETFASRFDKAGNRLVGQRGESFVGGTFNAANQLTATSAGGVVPIRGQVDKPVTSVTIDGSPAVLNGSGAFVGTAQVETGLNSIPIVVTEPDATVTRSSPKLPWRVPTHSSTSTISTATSPEWRQMRPRPT